MIILLRLEHIWEEPWLNAREVIGTAHVTVGSQKKSSSIPLSTNHNKKIEALLDRQIGEKGDAIPEPIDSHVCP